MFKKKWQLNLSTWQNESKRNWDIFEGGPQSVS